MSSTIKCLPHQAKMIQAPFVFDDIRFFFLIAGYAAGKNSAMDSLILTPTGFKRNGDLQLGEDVVSPIDGKAYKIDGIFPQGMKQTYRVYFSDGTSTVCGDEHLWAVQDAHGRQRKRPFRVVDTQELLKWKLFTITKQGDKIKNCFVPVNCPVNLTDYHESAAYAIGNFLADGCCSGNGWVITEDDVLEKVQASLASHGFVLKKSSVKYKAPTYYASIPGKKRFSDWLYEEYGITGTANQKRIPQKLLHADLETRRALLAGLVDGDGSTQEKSRLIDYTCVSKGLIEDIKFLARSLGVVVNNRSERIPEYTWNGEKRRGQTAYRISFSCPEKVELSKKHTKRLSSFKGKTKDYKAIVKIEKDVVQETQCIHIDSPDHLYIVDDWIVTHNTSSLVYSLFYIINYLSGYTDKEGKMPLIAVSATTLTFLKKTLVGSFTNLLDSSKSSYKYDKANNIMTINGVQLILLATEHEEDIYGYSVYCFHGDTQVPVLFNDTVRLLSIKDIQKGMYTLTRDGWKKVKNAWCSGKKNCVHITINGKDIVCTADHPFITERGTIAASDIKEGDIVYTISNDLEELFWNMTQITENLKSLSWTALGTTDIHTVNHMGKETILRAAMKIKKEVLARIIEICGKSFMGKYRLGMLFTIKMVTLLIIDLIIYLVSQIGIMPLTTLSSFQKKLLCMRVGERHKNIKENSVKMKNIKRDGWSSFIRLHMKKYVSFAKKCSELPLFMLKFVPRAVLRIITNRVTQGVGKKEKRLFASSVELNLKQINIQKQFAVPVTAKTLKEEGLFDVYDLEVEDVHEFYANGILVHNCSICDELDELPTDKAMAVVKALNDRTRQIIPGRRPPFLTFGTTSQGLKGTYLTVDEFKKKDISHLIIRGATRDNIYLPKEFVDAMYKIYDEKETKCLLEGQFLAIDTGRVFPQYDKSKHYLPYDLWDSLPAGSTVFLAQDFNQGSGFNKAIAVYVHDGIAYVIKEYDFPDWTTAPKVFRNDFPNQLLYWIPDMTYSQNFRMIGRSLQSYNIRPVYKKQNPLVSDRNFAINACFHSGRLLVCKSCVDASDAFMHWQNDKRTGQPSKGKTAQSPDHYGDCLGYAMYHIICNVRDFKDIFDTTLNRLNKKRAEQGFVSSDGLLLRVMEPVNKN